MTWADGPGDPGAAYARTLLRGNGIDLDVPEPAEPSSTGDDWARSGAMELTGRPDGPPEHVTGAPATTTRGALLALTSLAAACGLDPGRLPDERVLSERADVMGLRRNGRTSAGGASRLLDAKDGLVAITLSRPSDFAAIPALFERDVVNDAWGELAEWCLQHTANEVAERGTLLGLAIGAVNPTAEPNDLGVSRGVERPKALGSAKRLVVDLSALWAGPLCARLLGLLGARVIAVESVQRPDPTRVSSPEFHQLLRGDAEPVALDFTARDDLDRLRDLLRRADVVIEGSRPRALAQLGIDATEIAAESGCVWVSITAYGRRSNRIGYGDDVAAAAGLLGESGVFAGDAIADPMTGVHAAVAALSALATHRCGVVDQAMYDVVRAARVPVPAVEAVR